jgi:ADP-ribose pyrophosphatase YjhB (NUDIX family)
MITFKINQARFTYRVAWVCVHDNHVLLHRADGFDFWALPGGRVEIGEPSETTFRREIAEELGIHTGINVERLLWVAENFFTFEGTSHHELGLYYKVSLEQDAAFYDKSKIMEGTEEYYVKDRLKLFFQWFAVDTLDDVPLYPTFLRAGLRNLPTSAQHIVHVD